MANIFISYSRKDEVFARRLAKSLSDLGSDVWIDIEDIPAGMKWSSAIQEGLDLCEALIVVISPDSMTSTNVEDEWQYALDQKKTVMPVLYRPAKLHFQLSRIQYVNFDTQDYDNAFRQLHTQLGRKGVNLDPLPLMPAKSIAVTDTEPSSQPSRTPPYLALIAAAISIIAVILIILALTTNNSGGAGIPTATLTLTLQPSETLDSGGVATSTTEPTTPMPTSTRTRRPTVSASDLTATELALVSGAETEIALTDSAPEIATYTALTATADVLTQTAEAFTPTQTPNRQQTLRATRTSGAQTATAGGFLTQTQLALPTNTPTDTLTPTETLPSSATPVPTLTPAVVDCPTAPPTRLNNGMRAIISPAEEGRPARNQNIRRTPAGQIVAVIQEGTAFYIVGEPICSSGYLWWFIETEDGLVRGWAAEGALPDDYFITPILPDGAGE
jgi:hypothetical protein